MKIIKNRKLRNKLLIIAVLALLLIGICGVSYAKYIKQQEFTGSVTLKAEIGTIVLQEHVAVKQNDGSYKLLNEGACDTEIDNVHKHINSNTYELIPGLNIPKDPYLVITKENKLPVYIYVEIVSSKNDYITYEVSDEWLLLSGLTGDHGGDVYVYKGTSDSEKEVLESTEIYILDKNQVIVGQKLLSGEKSNLNLSFYGYMLQSAADAERDAVDVFNSY